MTLSGSGGEQFRGFLVQARTMADGSPVGVFTNNGPDQTLSACDTPEVSRPALALLSKVDCKTAKLPYIYTHFVSRKILIWLIGTLVICLAPTGEP